MVRQAQSSFKEGLIVVVLFYHLNSMIKQICFNFIIFFQLEVTIWDVKSNVFSFIWLISCLIKLLGF